jgi:peptidoglycan/LPS O-acetylase OafA/YrhL
MLGHQADSFSTSEFLRPWYHIIKYFDFANYGVQIFFVISGFLITYQLLNEEKATGKISYRNFYIRRVFRILPALFAFLIVAFILNKIMNGSVTNGMWFKAVFFL